jgi:hypothetical protein
MAPTAAAVASKVRRLGEVFELVVIFALLVLVLPFQAMTNPRRRGRALLSEDCGDYRNLAATSPN